MGALVNCAVLNEPWRYLHPANQCVARPIAWEQKA